MSSGGAPKVAGRGRSARCSRGATTPTLGNDLDNARRLGGLMWLMYGTVAAILLPLAPPTRALRIGRLAGGRRRSWSGHSLTGRRWLHHVAARASTRCSPGATWRVAQLATLQALAGIRGLRIPGALPAARPSTRPPSTRPAASPRSSLVLSRCRHACHCSTRDGPSATAADLGVRLAAVARAVGADDDPDRDSCARSARRCAWRREHAQELAQPGPAHGPRQPPPADGRPRRRCCRAATAERPLRARDVRPRRVQGLQRHLRARDRRRAAAAARREARRATMRGPRPGATGWAATSSACWRRSTPQDAPTTVERAAAGAVGARRAASASAASYGWVLLPDERCRRPLARRCASRTGACTRRRTSGAPPPAGRPSTCCCRCCPSARRSSAAICTT